MGLYGNILIEPAEPDYWPSANRDLVLTLDDVLPEDGKIASFSVPETSDAAMGSSTSDCPALKWSSSARTAAG
jgi:hypothetical protein